VGKKVRYRKKRGGEKEEVDSGERSSKTVVGTKKKPKEGILKKSLEFKKGDSGESAWEEQITRKRKVASREKRGFGEGKRNRYGNAKSPG